MTDEPRLTLDANILVRATLGRRVRDILSEHASTATFFAPEIAHADAVRWVPHILEDRGKGDAVDGALAYLEQLRHVVLPVPEEAYVERRDDSLARIGARDPDDWHIVATALVLDTPIWTEDQDFFGTGIPTWTTDRIELYLIRRI